MGSFQDWFTGASEEERILELINRRRRQILVHSCIYYDLGDNIISDHTWSAWAFELAELQKSYPEIAAQCAFHKEFIGFDGSTGCDLPLRDPWVLNKALKLLRYKKKGESQ